MVKQDLSSVFWKNFEAYNSGNKLIINQGGTRSTKTWSILQLLFLIALKSETKKVISVVSHALPHLKLGAMRDFDNILLNSDQVPDNIKNKTDNYYTINKSIIEFFGTDSVDKVHGPSRDILFVNEANFIKYDIYDQLAIRTKGCKFIDFNPTQSFWCHDDVMPLYKHTLIKSTYRDNEHLTDEQVKQIEAKKGIEKYANWWRVYGEGEIGQLEGVIYPDWEYGEFDSSLPYGYGLDFGFYPDPDALVKVAIDSRRKRIYLDECLYENNNGTEDLRKSLRSVGVDRSLIIADSAEARLISDLSGSFNIRKVIKKPGSVVEGIRLIQDYKLIVTERSFNLVNELKNYIWSDKKAGLPLDAFNHLLDAVRYWAMSADSISQTRVISI
jgi:phage terminase large subunit